ncbi:MAG: thrombospondin type 3 repeat-containing protein [Candidatus Kerfeldbacteria bacterium]
MSDSESHSAASSPPEQESKEMRRFRRAVYSIIGGLLVFNPRARHVTMRALRGARFGGAIAIGRIAEELSEAITIGYSLLEFKWVALAVGKLLLDLYMPHWGIVHVLGVFAFGLLIKHYEKAYMVARLQAVASVAATLGFIINVDRKDPYGSLGKALRGSGSAMSRAGWALVRKLQNEGHYFTLGLIICAFMPAGDTGLAWVIDPLAALCSLLLWEISSSAGNNKSVDGGQVVTGDVFDVARRKEEGGRSSIEIGKGRKVALPWFQSWEQRVAAVLIALCVITSWGIWGRYYGDYDHDGIRTAAEKIVYGTKWDVVDSDGDGFSDGYEVANHMDPLVAFTKDPKARRTVSRTKWANATREELRIRADSLKVLREAREDSLRIIAQAIDDSLKAAKMLHRDAGSGGTGGGTSDSVTVARNARIAGDWWRASHKATTAAKYRAMSMDGAWTQLLVTGGLLFIAGIVLMYKVHIILAGILFYPLVMIFNVTNGFVWGGLEKTGFITIGVAYLIGFLLVWGRWHDRRRRLAY